MKKKTKHKKQQDVTHPISESERIENLMRVVSNHGEPTIKLKYDKKLRKLISRVGILLTNGRFVVKPGFQKGIMLMQCATRRRKRLK